MLKQAQFEDDNAEYAAFVEKFKPKKTTDDCYTPKNIYEAIADWAARKYGFDKADIVRPFWPGGDYERFDYPKDCVVLDNPPFSILSRICRFYEANGIRYFLFAPALTLFSASRGRQNYIAAHSSITYENGAKVTTSFVTDMGEYLVETAPDLHDIIERLDDENLKATKKHNPKYEFPDCVATACRLGWLSVHGTEFKIRREDACFLSRLDAMGKSTGIFGGGFLLSERAAAERAAAERAAAERAAAKKLNATFWKLSEREREMQKLLGRNSKS